jgi:hypothetical protein
MVGCRSPGAWRSLSVLRAFINVECNNSISRQYLRRWGQAVWDYFWLLDIFYITDITHTYAYLILEVPICMFVTYIYT